MVGSGVDQVVAHAHQCLRDELANLRVLLAGEDKHFGEQFPFFASDVLEAQRCDLNLPGPVEGGQDEAAEHLIVALWSFGTIRLGKRLHKSTDVYLIEYFGRMQKLVL